MNSLKLTSNDRILILAPHPDDESLAAGGLIQRAVKAGAKVRVLFATDGDNNPWPQRFLERKLQISITDRARWGRRRRKEALAALESLGLPRGSARFLGLPDTGITSLLMRAEEGVLFTLWAELTEWAPTLFVMPSATDAHPDHSALFILVQLAMMRLERPPRMLRFIIHAPRRPSERGKVTLRLTPEEIDRKRAAILAHESQMALSRKRFSGYATDQEVFYASPLQEQTDHHHPVVASTFDRGALRVHLRLPAPSHRKLARANLMLALESTTEGSLRWTLPLPGVSRCVPIQDAVTGGIVRMATVRVKGRNMEVAVPTASLQPLKQVFLKYQRRVFLKDDAGWRETPTLPVPAPIMDSAIAAAERGQ
ncbi:MAG TPA: PIG-L family deacetylase [Chthoniobacteraceae bacterium]|jgi:LmbE family N-acetylglucosaminyl deacetylase|nr:PIG-L family deacetylase [Chthoniobacteraceae bacterium]